MPTMHAGSDRVRLGAVGVTWLSIAVDLVLSLLKTTAGAVSGSQAVFVDGLHSLSDLVTDFAVLWTLHVSGRPADEDHHYGHRRYSTLTALFVGAVLAGAAAWIGWKSVTALVRGGASVEAGIPLAAAVLSVLVKEVLYRITMAVGRREKDQSLVANAWHHRSDAFSSVAVAAGLGAVLLLGPEYAFVDSAMAAVLAMYLLWTAGRIMHKAAAELVDTAPEAAVMRRIRKAVGETSGVRSFHACRARKLGEKVVVDVHIRVDPSLTVQQGHAIASAVEDNVQRAVPGDVENVTVHVEPGS